MARIVLGRLAEKIYHEVDGPSIIDNCELVDVLEKYLADEGWKSFWLTREMDYDYAVLFVNEYREAILLHLTVEDQLTIADHEAIVKDKSLAETYITLTLNYFAKVVREY